MLDWIIAEEYLKECESAYAEIGSAGLLAVTLAIMPLRDRFNKGERSVGLWNEIFETSL